MQAATFPKVLTLAQHESANIFSTGLIGGFFYSSCVMMTKSLKSEMDWEFICFAYKTIFPNKDISFFGKVFTTGGRGVHNFRIDGDLPSGFSDATLF